MIASKATILCLYEILKKYTDESHILSAEKIREKLKSIYDVDMERRAIYRNIEALRSMGIEIAGYQDNREGYFLIDREFELSEIRLLCDAVAASDMIKESSGKIIIKKLLESQSIFQIRKLQECAFGLWQEIAETFGKNAAILKKEKENITVKNNTIPSVIHSWVMTHINQCEIIGPKSFQDKIQNEIMDAYRKYCM